MPTGLLTGNGAGGFGPSTISEVDGIVIDPDPLIGTEDSDSTTDLSADTVTLQFNLPIYAGGGVSSRVREAVHLQRAATDRLDRVMRETERLTRDSPGRGHRRNPVGRRAHPRAG